MARMKTGRLTTKTTPPQKNNGGTTNPQTSSQAAWDKYESDYKSYKNYDSDVKTYNEKKKKYDEEMKGASGGYDYLKFGGKSNTRRLSSTELGEFNKGQSSNNPNALEAEWVDVPKSYKGNASEAGAYMSKSKAPVAPVRRSEPSAKDLPMEKMPIRGTKITQNKYAIKTRKEVADDKIDFVNPPKNAKKKENVSMNPLAQGATTKGSGGRYAKQVIGSIGKTGENNRGYKKEEKRFKAFAGTTATGDDLSGMTPGEIRDYRSKAKSARAEYRKQPDSEVKSMGKAAMTSEIKQSRKAEKFAKQVYNLEGKGGVKFFNDKKYGGPIIKDYQESTQNAANRNTMESKIKAAGSKAKSRAASFNGQMPL